MAARLCTAWFPLCEPWADHAPHNNAERSQWKASACHGGPHPPGRRASCHVVQVGPAWASRRSPVHARDSPRCRLPRGGRCRSGAQRFGCCPGPWEHVQKWWWVQVLSFNKAPPEFIKKFRNFQSLLEKSACSKNVTKLLLSDLTIPPNYRSTKYWYSGQPFYK